MEHLNCYGVLKDVLSDHYPIFLCVKKAREYKSWKRILGRSYKAYNKDAFQALLSNDDWTDFYSETNPNALWECIKTKINYHLNVMCPIKYIMVSNKKPFWLSHHIIESINDRNKLYREWKKNPNIENLHKARTARNRTNKLINTSKQDFIKESLDLNKSDPKKFWRIINESLIKNQTSHDQFNLITDDDVSLSYEDSCTYMNDYLTGFGETLMNQFKDNPIDPGCPGYNSYTRATLLHEYVIVEDDVIKTINNIETSKGSGIDLLPTFILKDAFKSIISQTTYMMNQSLRTGIFPDAWAIASVTPIPKTGKLSSVKNWRPISILPLPGKILEKICTQLLLNELNENTILSSEQYGFRAGLSTSQAILNYIKHIIDGLNNKKVTAAVYLDFARAFDSVNFEILLLKLRDMGISDMLINWISGYLSNRQMYTKFNNCISNTKSLLCGVPQGSVVGPVLFLCYVNDIINVSFDDNVKVTLYADNTVIYCRSDDMSDLQLKMQQTLYNVSAWCTNNHMNLNVKKTKPCYYGSRHQLKKCYLKLHLNNTQLHPCTQYKYLGVILDNTINMEANLNGIFKKFKVATGTDV